MKSVCFAVIALAFAGAASAVTLTTDAGSYTAAADVTADLALTQAIADVKGLLSDNTDYAAVKAKYASSGIKAVADKDRTGEPVWDAFKAHFGSATWITDLVHKATDGTTVSADAGARAELIEKSVMDAVLVQAVISDCYAGRNGDQAMWDHCAAKFIGNTSSTIYGRANKRGKNYGTMDGTFAKVNKAVIAALNAGPTQANYDKIVAQIKVVYAQASLRYAFLVDTGVNSNMPYAEKQAEGLAFWRSLVPWVAAADSAGAAAVTEFYTPASAPQSAHWYNYCMLKALLEKTLKIPAADMGTLEKTSGVTCPVSPAPASVITTPAGDYTPTVDVGGSIALSQAIGVVKSLITDTPDYAKIKSTYAATGVQGAADKPRAGTPVYDAFKAYFGSATWLSDLVTKATDGTTLSANAGARAEIIEKTAMDGTMVQAVLGDCFVAQKNKDQKLWDHCAAKYVGDMKGSIWARANKRGKNYGTMDGTTAKANVAALAALKKGPSKANYDELVKQVKVTYTQATLRYAFRIDGNVVAGTDYKENHAEGLAFWVCLAPWVKAGDAAAATAINKVYDISKAPTATNNYCVVKAALEKALALPAADMGILEGTEKVDCSKAPTPPAAAASSAKAPATETSPAVPLPFLAAAVVAALGLLF